MTEDNKTKFTFFNKIVMSIKDFEQYGKLALEPVKKTFAYFALLVLLFTLIITAVFTYQFGLTINSAISYFNENINEVNFENDKLSINNGESIEVENEKHPIVQYLLIDTDVPDEEINSLKEKLNGYDNAILVLNDKIIYKNAILSQSIEYPYNQIASAYEISSFTKQDIVEFIQNTNMPSVYLAFFITMLVYFYVIYFSSILVDAIMLAVLGYIVARIAGMKLRFRSTFNIGIYALTLPVILNLIYIIINAFTGITVKYFNWMYTTISYIYVIVAILMIRTDLINRQMELMKIMEEQEKVRQELERKEEEERRQREREKQQENDKKEDNETEKEKSKEENKKTEEDKSKKEENSKERKKQEEGKKERNKKENKENEKAPKEKSKDKKENKDKKTGDKKQEQKRKREENNLGGLAPQETRKLQNNE